MLIILSILKMNHLHEAIFPSSKCFHNRHKSTVHSGCHQGFFAGV